jgi:hypothetical protein
MADTSRNHDQPAAAGGSWGRVGHAACVQLEDFARRAAGHLDGVTRRRSMMWDQWDRDRDGVFRRRDRAVGWRWNLFDDLESLPGYDHVCRALRDDPCIGSQVDTLVGTHMSSSRIEPGNVIRGIVNESYGKARKPSFNELRFASALDRWRDFFESSSFPVRLVAPLPGAIIDQHPLKVDGDDLVIDRLTDPEVAAALSTGLAAAFPADSPIFAGDLVGARRICWLDKVVSDEGLDASTLDGDGVFGRRPIIRLDLFSDDVATVLRLHSSASVVVSGALLLSTELGSRGMSWNVRQRPSNIIGNIRLTAADLSPLQDLWGDLRRNGSSTRKRPPPIAFSRFTTAFDRPTLQDRLVDLMISAEAIFLQDDGSPEDRGELSFRLALRAARFIADPARDKVAVFDEMKKAYALRSRLVHGATHATTPSDVDQVAELLRLALTQALAAVRRGESFGTTHFWKNLQLQ